jgi:hypothetical protein
VPFELEHVPGRHERRPAVRTGHLATGTLACPTCDAPVLLGAGRTSPADPIACGYCGHGAPARDFLSLAQPTRPARVVVRLRLAAAA